MLRVDLQSCENLKPGQTAVRLSVHIRVRRIDWRSAKPWETRMGDVQKFNFKKTGSWLQGEVEIRIQKKWLVIGAAVLVALVFIALD